ncbi:MAG: hypothetical protein IJW59_01380 [Clostridia bacterium]|nr:hypothetical protein [Clostridia bacterium]
MDQYLFDKIVAYENCVQFYTCRHLTTMERLISRKRFGSPSEGFEEEADHFLKSNAVADIYSPQNFKQFLNCLNLTKMLEGSEIYNIVYKCRNSERGISLDELLKHFSNIVFDDAILVSKAELSTFYKKAYEISNETNKRQKLMCQDPREFD